MPITKMTQEIPRDWWGHYTHPSDGTEARVYARVVYFNMPGSRMKFDVSKFEPGNSATLTHPNATGDRFSAKFEGVN